MDLMRGRQALPVPYPETVVTVGFFDGVHRGHQAVLGRTVGAGRDRGVPSVAVTFDRHPRKVLTPGEAPRLLTTLERKASLIEALGIDALVVLEFDQEFAAWPPEDFVQRVLAEGLHAGHAVIGANFTFGHKAMGNLATLHELGPGYGFTVEGVTLLTLGGRRISSSSIREALAAGDLAWPREALGRRFLLDGVVTKGAGRGAGLGYPTANLEVEPQMLLPAEGVYAGRAFVGASAQVRGSAQNESHSVQSPARTPDTPAPGYPAAINVGTNPTFGGEPLHVEAFLLDFDQDVRGRPMALEFWERLRDEERFDSPEALSRQIGEDVRRTREAVG